MNQVEMTEREYLRSIGFNVGERGRYSEAMRQALIDSGKIFNQTKKAILMPEFVKSEIKPHIKPTVKMREPRELYGYTAEGKKIGFVMCSECSMHMVYCACSGGIKAPSYVKTSTDPLVRFK